MVETGPETDESEKDKKLKNSFFSFESEPSIFENGAEKDEGDDKEKGESKKLSWLDKLLGKKKGEVVPEIVAEKSVLPAVELELAAPAENEPVEVEEATDDVETPAVEHLEIEEEDQEEEQTLGPAEVIRPIEVEEVATEDEMEESSTEAAQSQVVEAEAEEDTEDDTAPVIPAPVSPVEELAEQQEVTEGSSTIEEEKTVEIDNHIERIDTLVEQITEAGAEDQTGEPEQELEIDSAELEDDPSQAALTIANKIKTRVDKLESTARTSKKAEQFEVRKNVIAVSEKMATNANKLRKQQKAQLRNLMEVLGFESVDRSLELLLKRYGEQFLDEMVAHMMQILRQEHQEFDPDVAKKRAKLLKNLRYKKLGTYLLRIWHRY